MDASDDPERLRALGDAVLQAMGRNLLIYQRIEGNLKHLGLLVQPFTLYAGTTREEIEALYRQRHGDIRRHTLGRVRRWLRDEANRPSDEPEDTAPADRRDNVTVRSGSSRLPGYLDDLEHIIQARNHLAHTFLLDQDISTIDGCVAALETLDTAQDQAIERLHELRQLLDEQQAVRQEFAEWRGSPEAKSLLMWAWLISSPLITAFRDILTRLARPDGWTVQDSAVQCLRRERAEDVAKLQERYGYASLQEALDAAGLFESRNEPTARGHRRLCRPIPPSTQGAGLPDR